MDNLFHYAKKYKIVHKIIKRNPVYNIFCISNHDMQFVNQ